jgi:hypothetical protein
MAIAYALLMLHNRCEHVHRCHLFHIQLPPFLSRNIFYLAESSCIISRTSLHSTVEQFLNRDKMCSLPYEISRESAHKPLEVLELKKAGFWSFCDFYIVRLSIRIWTHFLDVTHQFSSCLELPIPLLAFPWHSCSCQTSCSAFIMGKI